MLLGSLNLLLYLISCQMINDTWRSLLGLGLTFALVSFASLAKNSGVAIAQDSLESHEILRTNESWDGSTLPVLPGISPEVTVVTLTISPGAILPVHLHTALNVAYVLAGELTVTRTKDPSGDFSDPDNVEQITVHVGDGAVETLNTWHYGENTGKENAQLLLIYVGDPSTPETLIAP